MNATAVSKPRYSAAVNATPRSFFPLLFFRNASPSPRLGRDEEGLPRALRGELRTLDRQPNSPSLYASSLLFFFFSYPFCDPLRPRYSDHSFFHFLLFRALASLPRFRRYPRETKGFSSRYTGLGSGY